MAEHSQPRETSAVKPELALRIQFHTQGRALFIFLISDTGETHLPNAEQFSRLQVQLCCEFRARPARGGRTRHDIPYRVEREMPVPPSDGRMPTCVLNLTPVHDAAALRERLLRRQRGLGTSIQAVRLIWPDGRGDLYVYHEAARYFRRRSE